jgi:aminotransferase
VKDRIADHVQSIPRSGIRDFFEIVQSMTDVISLGIGEPDFVTPWHIREAAIYSLEKGRTGYTSNLGLPRLRRSITDYVSRRFGLSYDHKTEAIICVGVSEAIDLALRALLNPGDEVLYHEPCYVSYNPSIRLAMGVPVPVQTYEKNGFALSAEDLEAAITPRSKVLILNFPTNPTGAVLEGEELRKIAELCVKHDLIVLSDEIYCEIIYDGRRHVSIASLPGMRERTVYLNGFSKAYAMTGFRIGYACAPEPLIDAMMRIHQYSILCAPGMGQEAAIEALEHGEHDVEVMRQEYERRRNFIVSAFRDLGIPCEKPGGAFYVFPRIAATGMTSSEFAMGLLREHSVAVVPGTAFGPGGEGYVRCSYATGYDQLRIALDRIKTFCASKQSSRLVEIAAAVS